LFFLIVFITGCSSLAHQDDLKHFNSVKEAVNYGINKEKITEKDLIGEVEENGELLIIFKKKLPTGIGLGVANISVNSGKYTWYRGDQLVIASGNIITEIKTQAGNNFVLYLGKVEGMKKNIIKTKEGINKYPIVDDDSGIYFYIEPK
jgi:hypothetical protein